MNGLLVPTLPSPAPLDYSRLVAQWLAGRKPTTIATYRSALRDFAAWLEVPDISTAARNLLDRSGFEANSCVLDYRAALLDRGLSPSTVNVRLAAIKSLVELAQTLGLISWSIRIRGLKTVPYRDTRGPEPDLIAHLLATPDCRDVAILRLLYCLALRRGEVASLDLADLDLERGVLWFVGKGRRDREPKTLPHQTRQALERWLAVRGPEAGPLFISLAPNSRGHRLTGASIWRIVTQLSAGRARPHGFRHAAITRLLDAGNSIRDVMQFSRHANPRTLMVYDDNRQDVAGQLAGTLDQSPDEAPPPPPTMG